MVQTNLDLRNLIFEKKKSFLNPIMTCLRNIYVVKIKAERNIRRLICQFKSFLNRELSVLQSHLLPKCLFFAQCCCFGRLLTL